MATDNARIAKNTIFLYFRMIVTLGVSLLTAGVTLRVLGGVDYGINAVLGGIVAMFSFVNGSLSGAASRHITFELGRGDLRRVNAVFNVSIAVFAALALVIVLLSETVGVWFFRSKMVIPPERMDVAFWLLQFSIASVPLALTQVPYSAVIIAHEDMKVYAYVSIADACARLAIVYGLLVSPFDKLLSLGALQFAWSVCTIAFYRVYCIRRYPVETKLAFCRDRSLYKGIFQFTGSDLIGNLSVLAQGEGFNLLLNTFFGPAVNAARGIAYALQGMTTQFSSNFMTAVHPQIVKSYAQGDLDGMWRLVRRASCFSYYLVWLLALPALLEGDFVLRLWLGDYPDHTLPFFRLIVVLCLIGAVKAYVLKVIHANGKLLLMNLTGGIICCLTFPVAYVCLRKGCPPECVFWCSIASALLSNVTDWLVVRRYMTFDIRGFVVQVYGRCLLVTILSAVLPVILHDRFFPPSILRMLLTGAMTTVSVGVVAFAFGMSGSDRKMLLSKIGQRILRRRGTC